MHVGKRACETFITRLNYQYRHYRELYTASTFDCYCLGATCQLITSVTFIYYLDAAIWELSIARESQRATSFAY